MVAVSSGLVPQARSAKDFFLHLMQDSQPRAAILAERERWLRGVKVDGREELLFELEMLLRGVERYFNLYNLGISRDSPVVTRDFRAELEDVRDALHQAIQIARQLLDPGDDQKMLFRRYVESQLSDDRLRRQLLEEELDQDSPQESLFVIRQSFESLRIVIDHLLTADGVPYPLFFEIGNLALRDIVLNHYFRPFRPLEFRIEYDRVKSVAVLEALRKLPPTRRTRFTVAFLALFRVLHYLSYVQPPDASADKRDRRSEKLMQTPPRYRVLLALVRSEITSLVGFIKKELATNPEAKRHGAAALKVARELPAGANKILKRALEPGAESDVVILAAVQLTELIRRQVVTLAHAIDAKTTAASTGSGTASSANDEPSFDELVSSTLMAQRLRLDLWLFSRVCLAGAEGLESSDFAVAKTAWGNLLTFITYFHDVSYQLLRYGDFEPVDRFTTLVLETESCPEGPVRRARLAQDCRLFADAAAKTFNAVGRRANLSAKKFDPAKASSVLARFLPEPLDG